MEFYQGMNLCYAILTGVVVGLAYIYFRYWWDTEEERRMFGFGYRFSMGLGFGLMGGLAWPIVLLFSVLAVFGGISSAILVGLILLADNRLGKREKERKQE